MSGEPGVTIGEVAVKLLSNLPALTYDELTVLINALEMQVNHDRAVADDLDAAFEARVAFGERVSIARSLLTAALEARTPLRRPTGGMFEQFRQAWDGDAASAAWR